MSAEGFITVVCQTREQLNNTQEIWGILRENFPGDMCSRIKGMKMLADYRGVAFDLAEGDRKVIQEYNVTASKSSFNFNFPYELPELVEEQSYGRGGGRGYGRNAGGYGGRGGGYGGRGG